MRTATSLPYTRSEAKAWAKANIVDFYECPLTPFTPDYELDADGIRTNVDAYAEMGVTGLVVGGFLAEAWNLTLADWKRYHEIYADANRGRMDLHTIILDPSVHVALEKMAFVQDLGYNGAEVINPIVQLRTDGEIYDWYRYLADHSDLAVVLYRTPVSGKVLSLDLVARLSEIDTIVGVKQGSLVHADSLRLRGMVHEDFIVSDPDEYWFLDDLRNGGQVLWGGFEYIVYGKKRHLLREYIDLARQGRWEEAREHWLEARPVYALLQEAFMDEISRTASYATATAVIKAWYEAIGLEAGGGRMLPPVRELAAERRDWLTGRLTSIGVI